MTADLDGTDSLGQMTITGCMIGLALGQFLAGPLSDRFGRRRPLLIGLAAYCLLSAACALAPTMPVLIALRFLVGLAGGAGVVISRAVVRDVYSGREIAATFSLLMVISSTAPILAPLAGGLLLQVVDWRGLYLAMAVLGGAILLGSVLVVRETLPSARRRSGGVVQVVRGFRSVLADRVFLACALMLTVSGAGVFTYISGSSFVLQGEYGLTPQQFSVVFGGNSVGVICTGLLNTLLVRRFSPRTLLTWGSSVALAGAVLCFTCALVLHALVPLLVTLFITIAAGSLVAPNATALAMERRSSDAGAASALIGTGPFIIGAAVAPLAALNGASAVAMTLVILVMLSASFSLNLLGVRRAYPAPGPAAPVRAHAEPAASVDAAAAHHPLEDR